MKVQDVRELKVNGEYPTFAWPGGYPIYYLTADMGTLCADCANGKNGSEAEAELDPECPDDDQWRLVAGEVYWEGPDLTCEHCDQKIESAYGDPEAESA